MSITCPRCGQDNQDNDEFCTGCEFPLAEATTLIHNHYRMTKPYIFSSFRAVYQAEDIRDNNRIYSIREFLPHFVNFSEQIVVRGQFESSMRRYSELSQVNLAGITNYFVEGNYFYVVYQYVNGKDMTKYLETHRIFRGTGYPESLVAYWAMQLCDLLEYLHHGFEQPFYAVDLKPAGIVFRQEDESIVFIDMGIFKLLQILGPHYIITEDYDAYKKARGKFESVGWDLFCLGNIMFYLLTGVDLIRLPDHSRVPLIMLRPDISKSMLDIVTKAVGDKGQSFYNDIREIKRDIKDKIPILPLRAFDFYSDFVAKKTLAKSVSWKTYLGTESRSACVGLGPKVPLRMKWNTKMKPSQIYFLSASDNYVYATSKEGMIYGINSETGENDWKFYIDKNISTPGIAIGNMLYYVTPRQDLVAIEQGENAFRWKLNLESSLMSPPTIYDDIIFVALYNGTIYAVNSMEGGILTSYTVEGFIISNPVVYNNVLFVSSLNKKLCAIDIDTEELLWTYESEAGFSASPTIRDNVLFAGSYDGTLCAVNTESGSPLWTRNFRGSITQSIKANEDMVYFITREGKLKALTPDRGEIVWEKDLNVGDFEVPFCLGHNMLYLIDQKRNLRCIDAYNGKERFSLGMSHSTVSQPIIAHEQLYLVSTSGHIVAFGK